MKFIHTINQIRRMLVNNDLVKTNGQPYSPKSIQYYNTTIKILMEIVEDFDLEEQDISTGKDLFQKKAYMNRWIMAVRASIQARGNENCTENSYVSTIVWVISKVAEIHNIRISTSGNNWSRIPEEQQLIVPEHARVIKMIKDFTPANENEQKAYKFIVAGIISGARYSDIASWSRTENILEIAGKKYLSYVPQKTKRKRINIPFNPLLESVFEDSEKLLPEIAYSTLLRYVKTVFRKMGFDKKVTRIRKVGNRKVVTEVFEHEIMGLHRIRASAITGFLQAGLSEMEAKAFSGHSANSRSFERYVDFSQKHLDSKFDLYANKFE